MITWFVAAAVAFCLLIYVVVKSLGTIPSLRTIRMFNKLPGPDDLPFFIGLAWDLFTLDMAELIAFQKRLYEKYGRWFSVYVVGRPTILCSDPELIEVILSSNKNIDKGPEYDFLKRWLMDGLLLSTGDKWRARRKMLTPSFHFKILEDSMECMSRNWKKVADKLTATKGAPVEPFPFMGAGALNIICETAMGTSLEDDDPRSKEYVDAVKRVAYSSMERALSPWLRNNFIYDLTSKSKANAEDLKIVHGFTDKVIIDRKAAFGEENQSREYSDSDGKKRHVFLDSLLELSNKENLNEMDIREEVDTFMFAGHDTTSTGLQYLMMHLGENPEVQEKAYQEQMEIFGYSDRDPTKEDLSKMHYLDQVIKESLRLHPPAPQIIRSIVEDAKFQRHIIPAGTTVVMNIYHTHRNPKYWDDPETFNPERFSLETSKTRHPYAYIPFSAGPRNCIGQKFAMMEMKIALSVILRFCKISAITRSRDLKYKMLVTLQPTSPIKVGVQPRNQF